MKTVSLETAKQLKEVGFPQETEFYWRVPDDEEKSTVESREKMKKFYYIFPTYASPTADEILEELPQTIKYNGKTYHLFISMGLDRQYFVVYANELDYEYNAPFPIKMRHSLAEAVAEIYLYLKKEGLI